MSRHARPNLPRSENAGRPSVSRRQFVTQSSAFFVFAITGCISKAARTSALAPGLKPSPWEEASIAQLRSAIDHGKLTAASLTRHYLDRIEALNHSGPALRAVLDVNPDAMSMARALDRQPRDAPRGPLHGIPILIKDNIDTHDRMATTAGSLALARWIPGRDAFVVEQLRRAGAVVLGKTNLSEWANFRSNRSSSGWSARGGQTLNPYVLDRNPCGSSSGSGVAVAANLCAAAIGTETDGSIVCPASTNGIVGLKPTVGLVSRSGIIPISQSQDTAGPMTRTVADAALLLSILAGEDSRDSITAEGAKQGASNYSDSLDANGLKGARVGVARNYFGFHAGVDRLMGHAIVALQQAGAEVIDPIAMPNGGRVSSEFEVLLHEFKDGLNKYLAALGPEVRVHSLAELIEFNESHAAQEMPYFGQEIFVLAQAKGPLTDKVYLEALEKCRVRSRAEGIDAIMDEHRLDAIVAPTAGPASTIDLVYGDHGRGGCSSMAAVAGYPHLTVPAGQVYGLPVGFSFFGRAYSEPTLLKLAYSFEQKTQHRAAPKFLKTARVH